MTDDRRPIPSPDPDPDVLDRAAAALRDAPVPDGPPPHVVAATLISLRPAPRQVLRSRRTSVRTSRHFSLPQRIAAAVLVAGCGAAVAFAVAHRTRPTSVVRRQSTQPVQPAPAPAVAAAALLHGTVVFDGPPPPPRAVPLHSMELCAARHPGPVLDESLVVGPGRGLANVVVSVESGLPAGRDYPAPPRPAVLDQEGCVFLPHVVTMQVGQSLVAKNGDPFLHTVHTLSRENVAENKAQPAEDRAGLDMGPVKAAEVFKVKCDIHPWMSAWVAAFDHPYFAVSRDDGRFDLPPLPPGRYVVRAWHETLGVREKTVVIGPGQPATLDFAFGPAHADARGGGGAGGAGDDGAVAVVVGATRVMALGTDGAPCASCGTAAASQ